MRLVDLLLLFTGTDWKSVSYKVPTVLHEPCMWTKWFVCLDIEFRYYVAPLQWLFRASNFFSFRRCCRRSRGLCIIDDRYSNIYIYIIFKYIYKYIYLACIFLHNIFFVIFKSQVLTPVIYILLVTIGKLSAGVDNIHYFFIHVVSRGSHLAFTPPDISIKNKNYIYKMNSCKTCHLKDSNICKNHFCICTSDRI